MVIFRNTFLIRPENFARAAKAVLDAGLVPYLKTDTPDRAVLNCAFDDAGLRTYGLYAPDKDGCRIYHVDYSPTEDTIALMEQVFKAISKSVEPGTYIEFADDETLVRYVFLYDAVERWTVPSIMYAKKEAL